MINIITNPFLKKRYFSDFSNEYIIKSNTSLSGAILLMFSLTVVSFVFFWIFSNELLINSTPIAIENVKNFSFVSGVISFIIAFFAYYKPGLSPILAPLYAVFSGIFISGLSFAAEQKFPGIAMLTAEVTLTTFIIVYIGYKIGIIKVTQKFKSIVYSLIGIISFLYLLSFILMLFNTTIPLIHEAGIGGVIWTFFIMATASFHLAIDIDKVEKSNTNKGYENWNLALGLMVSLIWLYFSTLRFLSRIKSLK